ncbi:MAG: hypothetical protein DMG59_29210 [Acidobacteria bacterium]|nr:MAG: hypothetical protein DMG59_29210 [Acidobacteriota bacterium]
MALEVGQEYPKSIAFEGGQYNYYDGYHDLLLAYRGLEQWEIDDVRNAAADFALFANPPLLFLLYRFGSVGWGNCPYCWHLGPVTPPELLAGEQRISLTVTLVELPGNVVRVIRAISLPPDFSRALVDQIRVQATTPRIDRMTYIAAINRTYAAYTVDLMASHALIRCRLGA